MKTASGESEGTGAKPDYVSALEAGPTATTQRPKGKLLAALALGALGVVY